MFSLVGLLETSLFWGLVDPPLLAPLLVLGLHLLRLTFFFFFGQILPCPHPPLPSPPLFSLNSLTLSNLTNSHDYQSSLHEGKSLTRREGQRGNKGTEHMGAL